MRRHKFEPSGGMQSNPGVWDNTHGGLIFVDKCACGVVRKQGKDVTQSRPSNNWGPEFSLNDKRLKKAGSCPR